METYTKGDKYTHIFSDMQKQVFTHTQLLPLQCYYYVDSNSNRQTCVSATVR